MKKGKILLNLIFICLILTILVYNQPSYAEKSQPTSLNEGIKTLTEETLEQQVDDFGEDDEGEESSWEDDSEGEDSSWEDDSEGEDSSWEDDEGEDDVVEKREEQPRGENTTLQEKADTIKEEAGITNSSIPYTRNEWK